MKKKLLVIPLVLVLLISSTSAATSRAARWAVFDKVITQIEMTDDGIVWGASASTYPASSVTYTKVEVKLQVQTSAGWGTIDTVTDRRASNLAGIGGDPYTGFSSGESYRIRTEAWAYSGTYGTTLVENIGPFYDYLNT